ncbi:hypothetical protein Q4E93_34085 [Flavitalea sp. BT771]|uniref:hypothetical protein n=1 Tax=Flavitalea sp. BT771 TaxID=3063329 RepID=UPI0026E34CDC|nr:hypothetical protein [Flavitalea sp. BT771]MDO6435694.1 hypothetical protein [Flavitalea sp. BT771]MDV6224595.1 hypothetical protein [Flavitalea sp. BT771]
MDFELIPFEDIRNEITLQASPELAFKNILQAAKRNYPALDWEQFSVKYMDADISAATRWIKKALGRLRDVKGIYLGLDTLNMEDGKGSNVEIGINANCDPTEISVDWAFDCDTYGDRHLIKGLYSFFANFAEPDDQNKDLAEYVIFLGYSGLVLREALLKANIESDFISCWGFHDGDLLLLMNKIGQKITFLANKEF